MEEKIEVAKVAAGAETTTGFANPTAPTAPVAKPHSGKSNSSSSHAGKPHPAKTHAAKPTVSAPSAAAEAAETPQHHLAQMKHDPVAIRRVFETGEYPYASRLRTAPYEEHMLKLQQELLKAQRWVESTGEKIVLLFEGRDAAGKGGTIKRFMEHLNPRGARVVALEKPNERERTQWYFQRYIQNLPAAG